MRSFDALSDLELMALLKEGDHAAFEEIYRRHWKFLFIGAYKATNHTQDSRDICQSVFVWLWENHAVVNFSVSIRSYLHTAVKYKIANLIKKGKVRETLLDELESVDSRRYAENELEIKELKHFISQLINDLPPRCREIFLLSRDEQLSHKEIAEQLGLSEKTVDEQVHRALKKLRAPLGKMATLFLLF